VGQLLGIVVGLADAGLSHGTTEPELPRTRSTFVGSAVGLIFVVVTTELELSATNSTIVGSAVGSLLGLGVFVTGLGVGCLVGTGVTGASEGDFDDSSVG